jgi:hypothetical protein
MCDYNTAHEKVWKVVQIINSNNKSGVHQIKITLISTILNDYIILFYLGSNSLTNKDELDNCNQKNKFVSFHHFLFSISLDFHKWLHQYELTNNKILVGNLTDDLGGWKINGLSLLTKQNELEYIPDEDYELWVNQDKKYNYHFIIRHPMSGKVPFSCVDFEFKSSA